MNAADLVFDIEVVPSAEWTDLDEATRRYLTERSRGQLVRDGIDAECADLTAQPRASERLALELGMAKVVAIGLADVATGSVAVLLDNTGDAVANAKDPAIVVAAEPDLLRQFWKWVRKYGRIISFNGRMFDGPVLHIRSAQLGVVCTRQLIPYRYDLAEHCDLAEVLNFQGTVRNNYSLDYWTRRFGIASPKVDGIDGRAVAQLYRDGRLLDIGDYVMRDVLASRELYLRLRASFAHLFKGGPALAPLDSPVEAVA